MPPLNILFLGSDLFSIGTLQPLLRTSGLWSSLRVVTAGEKDVGRGGKNRRRMAREFGAENEEPLTDNMCSPIA